MDAIESLRAGRQRAIALRRWFHAHPETSLAEHATARRIEEELDRIGLAHRRVGETGVFGWLRGDTAGPVTALRADTDALAVKDEKTAPYRSRSEGACHACGHDLHTAALLSAARALAADRGRLRGEIRFFFQQGEEIGAGASLFIREGLLQGVSRIMGLHAASDLDTGTVAVRPGPSNAACDYFEAVLTGRAVHASTPHLGADALYAACHAVVGLQAVAARLTDPLDPVVAAVGTLKAGDTYNTVAGEAVLEGTTRSFSAETRARVNGAVERIILESAALFGVSGRVVFSGYSPPLVNDPAVVDEMRKAFGAMPGIRLISDPPLRLGADDFAEYLEQVPGAYAFVGTRNPALPGTDLPHHSGYFDVDEEAVPLAAELYVRYALFSNGSG